MFNKQVNIRDNCLTDNYRQSISASSRQIHRRTVVNFRETHNSVERSTL